MNNGLCFALGVVAGAVVVGVISNKAAIKKIATERKALIDQGFNEAHEDFERLLAWAEYNHATPGQLIPLIRGEV